MCRNGAVARVGACAVALACAHAGMRVVVATYLHLCQNGPMPQGAARKGKAP